jgi:hypothetical protein
MLRHCLAKWPVVLFLRGLRPAGVPEAGMFVAANVQSLTQIPVSLAKPQVTLTPAQEALAIQHLLSVDQIASRRGCRVELKWMVGGAAGARSLGPG